MPSTIILLTTDFKSRSSLIFFFQVPNFKTDKIVLFAVCLCKYQVKNSGFHFKSNIFFMLIKN